MGSSRLCYPHEESKLAKSTLKLVGVYDAWSPRARQARLTRSNGAEVPVLVLISPDTVADADVLASLRDDARLIARLQHENVMRLENVSAVTGKVAHVYEGVDGASAARIMQVLRMRNQPVPARVAIELVAAVGLVLEEALRIEDGARRLVHAGTNPEEVLIDLSGRVKLAGISVMGDAPPASPAGYAAPEGIGSLAAGTYMLGALLVELLTGEAPPAAGINAEQHDGAVRRGLIRIISRPSDPPGDMVVQALRQALAFEPATRGTPGTLARRLRELAVSVPGAGLRSWAPGFVPAAQKAPTAWPSSPQSALASRPLDIARPLDVPLRTPGLGVSMPPMHTGTFDLHRGNAEPMGGSTIVPMEDGSEVARQAAALVAAYAQPTANAPALDEDGDFGDQTVAIPTRNPLPRPSAPAPDAFAALGRPSIEPRRPESQSPGHTAIPVSVGPSSAASPPSPRGSPSMPPGPRINPSVPPGPRPQAGRAEPGVQAAEPGIHDDATMVAGLRPLSAPGPSELRNQGPMDPAPARPQVSVVIDKRAPDDDPFEEPPPPQRSRMLFVVAGGALALGLVVVVVMVVAAVFLNGGGDTDPVATPSSETPATTDPSTSTATTPADPVADPAPPSPTEAPAPTTGAAPEVGPPAPTTSPTPSATQSPPPNTATAPAVPAASSAPATSPKPAVTTGPSPEPASEARITPTEAPRITPAPSAPAPSAPAPTAPAATAAPAPSAPAPSTPTPVPTAAPATPAPTAAAPPAEPAALERYRVEFKSGDPAITSIEVKCINKSGSGVTVVLDEVGRGPCRVTGRGMETPLITSAVVTANRSFVCFQGGARTCQ